MQHSHELALLDLRNVAPATAGGLPSPPCWRSAPEGIARATTGRWSTATAPTWRPMKPKAMRADAQMIPRPNERKSATSAMGRDRSCRGGDRYRRRQCRRRVVIGPLLEALPKVTCTLSWMIVDRCMKTRGYTKHPGLGVNQNKPRAFPPGVLCVCDAPLEAVGPRPSSTSGTRPDAGCAPAR